MEGASFTIDRALGARNADAVLDSSWETASLGGNRRWSVLRRFLLGADSCAALTTGIAVGALGGLSSDSTLLFTLATWIAWVSAAFVSGSYASADLTSWSSGTGEGKQLLFGGLVLSWPIYGLATWSGSEHAMAIALGYVAVALILSVLARGVARALAHRAEPLQDRTLIIGSGSVAGRLASKLRAHNEFGLVPIGIVDDEVHDLGMTGLPHLGRLHDLGAILREHAVDRVVIAFSRARHDQLLQCVRACRDRRVSIHIVPRLFELVEGARTLDHIGGLPLLSIGVPPLTRTARVAKRALDVTIAGLGLLLAAPLLIAIAIAIKLDSPGPALFRQPRAGRGGRIFNLFKFRSMYVGADDVKPLLEGSNDLQDGVMFKIHEDPRVTRVGRFLRRSSLDELPQLVNVLLGEMSLVGPRPLILPESNALAESWQSRRLDLRPGLTGPWQIYGRSAIPFEEMVRFDYQYVAGWSLARDLEILMATVPAIISGRGAY
jgi:exopolysaccharide biosynthesis polyprenyl glycosylphosphotransferase